MGQELTTRNKTIQDASNALSVLLESNVKAIPKGFNQTRFLQNCLTVLSDTEDIEKCTPSSIARCMIKGAYLGLDFYAKECYAIPYGNKLQFQTDLLSQPSCRLVRFPGEYESLLIPFFVVLRQEFGFLQEVLLAR